MSAAPSPAGARHIGLRVVRGNPGPEELAALLSVLLARRACAAADDAPGPAACRATWDRSDHDYRSPLAWVL